MAEMFDKKTVMATVKKILDKYAKAYEISRSRSVELMRSNEAKMETAEEIYDAIGKIKTEALIKEEQRSKIDPPNSSPIDIPKPTFDPNKPENRRKEHRG